MFIERALHQPLFAQAPLAQLAVAFASGVLLTHFTVVPLQLALFCSSFASLAALLALARRQLTLGAAFLLAAMFSAGAILANIEAKDIPQNQLKRLLDEGTITIGAPVELTGVVEGPVDYALERSYFILRVEGIRFRGVDAAGIGSVALIASLQTTAARNAFEEREVRHGARIRVMTALRRTNSFRNPGVPLSTEYLDRKGYDATGFIKSPLLIERLDDESVFLPLAWLYQWRQDLQRQIDQSFSRETAGVLDASLLGNRYNLLPATAERFRVGGTFHVLVISGLHISFIGGVVFLISQRLTRRRGIRFLLSALVLWGFTLAVGAEASVVRAALMFTMVALAPVIFRRASSLNALGAAALLLIAWHPQNLFDPSFQLTFLSVLAIVALAWPLLQKLAAIGSWQPTRETPYPPASAPWLRSTCECLFWSERQWQMEMSRAVHRYRLFKSLWAARLEKCHAQRGARYVVSAVVVSGSVQLVLLPLMIVYFHRVSLASLILNIGVSLLMAALSLVAMTALFVAQFSAVLATPLINIANGLTWLMVHSVDPFAQFDLASIRLPDYSGPARIVYWLYYAPLALLAVGLWRWNPLQLLSLKQTNSMVIAAGLQSLLVGIVFFHPLSAGMPDGRLHIDFIDVGQGDSTLVTMPDGATLLIDGGGRPDFSRSDYDVEGDQFGHEARGVGEAVVSEYLWWRGLDSIDYILATHADADHIDGLNDVARNFHVRAALAGRAPDADPEFKKFAETLKLRNIPLSLTGEGDLLRFDGISAAVLWPPASSSSTAPSRNNDSVALRLKFKNRAILLTGDLESGAEKAILESGTNLMVDVVKVAHHGSKTSSIEPFVYATRPRLAVISVGQTSVFGHPSKEVVERWKASGAEVLTTGGGGTITITTDGYDLAVSTFVRK